MRNLRIAFIAYNLGQGGAERQLFYMVKALTQQGCIPDVFTFSQDGFWETPLRELGVRTVSINAQSKIGRIREFVNFINLGNYHYVHSQQFCTNLYAVVASLLNKADCIGSIRNDVISEVRGMGFMGWFSLVLPEKMVANSKAGIENAKRYFRRSKNIYFLPNVVDTDIFSPSSIKKKNDRFKVLTVGTVWKPKRIDRVIEVAEIVRRLAKKDIIFEIIGDGDQLETMIALAKKKSLLNSVVYFKGRSSNIAEDLRTADALLLTSDYEGTPNVALEAMSSGLPVIASDVGDVSRIIVNGQTGFVVERENLEKMAEIILELSNNESLCLSMGKKAREFIENNHSMSKLTERLKELYTLR